MARKLTQEQVQKLFAFCEKQEVYDYDLQIEIVDHLASSIEDQWKEDPNLTFGWAFKNIYSKFGWKRFRKLESQMTRQLKRKFRRILFNYFLEFFQLPKILITIVLTLSIFALLQIVANNSWVVISYCVPLSIISIYYNFKYFPERVEIKPVPGKSFVLLNYLDEINKTTGSVVHFSIMVLLFSRSLNLRFTNTAFEEFSISLVLSLLTVLFYGYFFFLPQKIREYFFTHYSEFAR